MKTKSNPISTFKLAFVICFLMATAFGCSHGNGLSKVEIMNNPSSLIVDLPHANTDTLEPGQEKAVLVAIVEIFQHSLNLENSSRVGGIFLRGMSTNVVDRVAERIGDRMPIVRKNFEDFDGQRWIDKITGKPALVVTLYKVEKRDQILAFQFYAQFHDRGGSAYYLELSKFDNTWRIIHYSSGIE